MRRSIPIDEAQKIAGDSPTLWFSVLDGARLAGNADLAQWAEAELRRLGVHVTFDRWQGGGQS